MHEGTAGKSLLQQIETECGSLSIKFDRNIQI